MFRVGFGFDTHKLEPGLDFRIGGVSIPHERGAAGHSDADVLIHAIIDAMLGAAGLADIGTCFPDHDPQFRGIDSRILLRRTLDMVAAQGYMIGNIDSTVVLEKPKIAPFIPGIRETLAGCMNIDVSALSVKAKTSEKLGFIGREEGVSAYAVVMLVRVQTT